MKTDHMVSAGADDRVRLRRGVVWAYRLAQPVHGPVNLADRRTSWPDPLARRSTWFVILKYRNVHQYVKEKKKNNVELDSRIALVRYASFLSHGL